MTAATHEPVQASRPERGHRPVLVSTGADQHLDRHAPSRPGREVERCAARPSGGVTGAVNAARVLKAFRHTGHDLGVTELAQRLHMAKSTTHRVLQSLVAEDLLELREGRYRLAVTMHDIGSSVPVHQAVRRAADSILASLNERTGHAVQISVLDGRRAFTVLRCDTRTQSRPQLLDDATRRCAAHRSAPGRALLAGLPLAELDRLLRGWVMRVGPGATLTTPAELRPALLEIRRQGFAAGLDEPIPGLASVAVPLPRPADGTPAALSLLAPSVTIAGNERQVATMLAEAAAVIGRRLSADLRHRDRY